jgi:hypothetical protein
VGEEVTQVWQSHIEMRTFPFLVLTWQMLPGPIGLKYDVIFISDNAIRRIINLDLRLAEALDDPQNSMNQLLRLPFGLTPVTIAFLLQII